MLGSFLIGRVFGINIRVHWLFLALVVFLTISGTAQDQSPLSILGFLAMLFGVVFLHELGHSLVAQAFGVRVLDITFWPLGGMARMAEIPENTRAEALIAAAGPLVNFVLAGLAVPLWLAAMASPTMGGIGAEIQLFLYINLALGLFNMIPAFPMDGGRILRAFLGRRGDWVRATERAVAVGRVFAVLMVIGAFWNPITGEPNFMLALIGAFVWFAGARELFAVRLRRAERDLRASNTPAGAAFRFFTGGAFRSPVARAATPTARAGNGNSAGASPEVAPENEVDRVQGARRPANGWAAPDWRVGPYTDERIREFERFRGRMNGTQPGE